MTLIVLVYTGNDHPDRTAPAWHGQVKATLLKLGMPDEAWTQPLQFICMHRVAIGVCTLLAMGEMVRRVVTVYQDVKWAREVQVSSMLRRVYAPLGRTMAAVAMEPAQYLRELGRRARVVRTRLRGGQMMALGAVSGRMGPWARPYEERGPCAMCGAPVVESERRFLLECTRWQAERQCMWTGIRHKVGGVVANVVDAAVATRDLDRLYRVVLEGNCAGFMPDGYMVLHHQAQRWTEAREKAKRAHQALTRVVDELLRRISQQRERLARAAPRARVKRLWPPRPRWRPVAADDGEVRRTT